MCQLYASQMFEILFQGVPYMYIALNKQTALTPRRNVGSYQSNKTVTGQAQAYHTVASQYCFLGLYLLIFGFIIIVTFR